MLIVNAIARSRFLLGVARLGLSRTRRDTVTHNTRDCVKNPKTDKAGEQSEYALPAARSAIE